MNKSLKYAIVGGVSLFMCTLLYQLYEISNPQIDPVTKRYLIDAKQGSIDYEQSLQRSWQSDCEQGNQDTCKAIEESKVKVQVLKQELEELSFD